MVVGAPFSHVSAALCCIVFAIACLQSFSLPPLGLTPGLSQLQPALLQGVDWWTSTASLADKTLL
jgi:hypothetical protein